MIAVICLSGHGGTLLVVPSVEVPALDAMLRVKCPIADGPPRRRFRAVLLAIANALARSRSGEASGPLGWEDYARSRDAELARLDESVFEPSHMIAGLAAVDGTVVMTSGFESLGFGSEITGRPPEVPCVAIITDDVKGALAKQKPRVAVYVGGMGPRDENFHKEMMVRRGFGDAAQRIQELFLAKRKDEAVAAVPDEFCDEMSLVGPVARIRERYRPWTDSGITGLTITTD